MPIEPTTVTFPNVSRKLKNPSTSASSIVTKLIINPDSNADAEMAHKIKGIAAPKRKTPNASRASPRLRAGAAVGVLGAVFGNPPPAVYTNNFSPPSTYGGGLTPEERFPLPGFARALLNDRAAWVAGGITEPWAASAERPINPPATTVARSRR